MTIETVFGILYIIGAMFTITLDQMLSQASQKKLSMWATIRTNLLYVLWPMALAIITAHQIMLVWRILYALEYLVKLLEIEKKPNDNHPG